MMIPILIAIGIVGGLGLIAGLGLAIASTVMAVPRDEKIDELTALLPGINCGACGYSGCEGYASAMVRDGAAHGLCTPGGNETAKATATAMGAEAGEVVLKKAVVRCGGCAESTGHKMVYHGLASCEAATQFFGGDMACRYGCLGYGDCADACPYGAIGIRKGIAVVDTGKCTGCGMCVKTCPKTLIALKNENTQPVVLCRSHDKGGVVRKLCTRGCIGCMKCVKVCEAGAISVNGFLAEIDPEKCTSCNACVDVCPSSCITRMGHIG